MTAADIPLSPEGELCARCGMCCDGTLFSRLELDAGETADARTVGLNLVEEEGQFHVQQPCSHLSDGLCGIYACRFRRCADYRCGLLQKLDANALTFDECHAHVDFALRLRAEIAEEDREAVIYDNRRQLRRDLGDALRVPTIPGRQQTAQRLLKMAALDRYLDTWFRDRGQDRQRP